MRRWRRRGVWSHTGAGRYDGLDARITTRLFGMLAGAATVKRDDSAKIAKIVARGIESRPDQTRRSVTREILHKVFQRNQAFTDQPELRLHPDPAAARHSGTSATDHDRRAGLPPADVLDGGPAMVARRPAITSG